jgi:hypothetical protein
LPVVMSIMLALLTSGTGQQVTLSTVPAGQCPEVTLTALSISEMSSHNEINDLA